MTARLCLASAYLFIMACYMGYYMSKKTFVIIVLTTAFLLTLTASYNFYFDKNYSEVRDIKVLRIGLVPSLSDDKTYNRYKEIFEGFTARTNIPYKYIHTSSYSDLVDKFISKEVDFAYFGGATYIKAYKATGAVPLVMRDVDMAFTSSFIVPAKSSAKTIQDLKGKKIAFGSELSTSGHFMPRHFMKKEAIVPEDFFGDIVYSGSHDKTVFMVRGGKADIGVANSEVVESLYNSEKITKENVRVLSVSPEYPDYVWAIQRDVSPAVALSLKKSFIDLSLSRPDDIKILKKAGATFFVSAKHEDFQYLEKIIEDVKENQ